MAKTITIRRVGSIFPALCLVVIVLVCFSIAWLSFVGLPDFVLRKLEREAAPYGIHLRLGKLKLAPAAGLAFKAQDIRISALSDTDTIELGLRKLQVSFSVFELLQGNYLPNDIHLLGMEAQLPTGAGDGKSIQMKDTDTRLNLFNRGKGLGVDTSATIQGIKVHFRGDFKLPQLPEQAGNLTESGDSSELTPEPIRLEEYISPIQPWLRKADDLITEQQWIGEQFPQIDIKLRKGNQQIAAEIKADVPLFRHGNMHFRNASLATRFEDNTFTIDHLTFATTTPRAEVSLQGAYDLSYRRLSFDVRSTAAIAQIIEMIDSGQKGSLLSRLCADANKTPTVKLRGQVEFSDNYALNNISLRGNILQKDFYIGNTEVDAFELSFMLSDGRFNIDNLNLTLPDGNIKLSALSGYEQADARVEISLPFTTFHQLAEGISGSPINLPEAVIPGGRLNLSAGMLLKVNVFTPGSTLIADLIPSIREIQYLSLGVDSLRYGDLILKSPTFTLKTSDIEHPTFSGNTTLQLNNTQLTLKAKELEWKGQYSAVAPDILLTFGHISADCDKLAESLHIAEANAEAKVQDLSCGDLQCNELSCTIRHLPEYTHTKKWEEMLVKSDAEVQIQAVYLQQRQIASKLNLSLAHPHLHEADLVLTLQQQDTETSTRLNVRYHDLEQDGVLNFSLPKTELPLLAYAPVLHQFDALPTAIELPESLFLETNGSINIYNGQLGKTKLALHIPELHRTPHTLVVNRGSRIPLDISLNAELQSAADDIAYTGNVNIRHDSGAFIADIDGKLSSYCNISRGHNTIAVNVIDTLIDDEDAHAIMRDFRFDQESSVTVSDIAARIEYDNGIGVNSFCKADIRNTDFLIGAIEDVTDNKGNIIGEKLRTDMGANPYSRVFQATCDVLVDVQLGKTNPDGSAAPEKMQVILNSPRLNYDNRPWLKRQGIKQGSRSSIIQGESIVFDLDNSGIVLNNLKGKAYPAYAFGMYFAPLQEFMKDIRLQYPVDVNTKRCEFPISMRSQVPISGLIRAESTDGAAFDFLGTTIPLNRFSGFVNLSDDFVFLDKMNARTWGGVLDGAIKIGISGERTSFDGQLTARNLDLQHIGKAYKTKLSPALCNASIRFQSPTSEVKDVKAYGHATISDGNLMELGIFQPVGSLISDLPGQLAALQRKVTGKSPTPVEEDKPGMISRFLSAFTDTTESAISKVDASSRHIPFANHFMSYNIQNAALKFDILNGYLYTRDMKAAGYNLDVDMNLRLNLDTLELRGNLWPRISSVPTLLIAPITFLSDFLIDIVIYGNIEDIRWKFTLDKIMKKGRKNRKPSVTAAEEH